MLKKLFSALLIATATMGSISANEGYYIGGYGGLNLADDKAHDTDKMDFRNDYTAGMTLGHRWASGWRLESEMAYHRNGVKVDINNKTGAVETASAMGNAIYEIPLESDLRPHIGGGVGYAKSRLKLDGQRESTSSVALQGIAGVTYNIVDESTSLAADYRYFSDNQKTASHSFTVGVQQYF